MAIALTGFGLVLTLITIALDLRSADVDVPPAAELEPGWLSALTGLAQLIPGALLLRQLPRQPIAWVLVASGLVWVVDGFASSWAIFAIYVEPGTVGAAAAHWFYSSFGSLLLLGLPLLLLLFPDGRLPASRAWRSLSIASLISTAILPLVLLVVPFSVVARFQGLELPQEISDLALDPVSIDLPYALWRVILTIAYAGVVVSLVVPFAVTVHRYRSSEGDRRAQMRWLVWAALVDMFVLLFALQLPGSATSVLLAIAVALTSLAIVVAVTKYRLYDVDRLLSATVLYGALALSVVVVDIAVFAVAGTMLGERDSALVAIVIVAIAYGPLRHRLSRLVTRAVRGTREDPYATVSVLAERLEVAADPDQQLLTVARSVSDAFRLPYVRVEIERPGGETAIVEHGVPTAQVLTLPVHYRGEPVGRLVVSSPGRADLSERDQRLLGDLVRQAAAAARATELSAALQGIREQLVGAREEERRRMRRDLHDSLGPSLGALTLRIETARNLMGTAPDEADRLLEQTTVDVSAILSDVRRLVHDLRPPALDELGLVGAVEQQAQLFKGGSLQVTVRGDAGAAALPAAVEVAAYRIVSEALANVSRHAQATHCEISLRVTDTATKLQGALEVEIRDDGIGIGTEVNAGVGTLSLRERAAELGGSCEVSCPAEGGTVVRAVLPLTTMREMVRA